MFDICTEQQTYDILTKQIESNQHYLKRKFQPRPSDRFVWGKSIACIFSCTAAHLWWRCDAAEAEWHWAAGWRRGTEGSQMARVPSLRGQQASQAVEAGSVAKEGNALARNTSLCMSSLKKTVL